MNTIKAIDVSYLHPSRTIETVLLKNNLLEKVLYVYNLDGIKFWVFKSILDILNFFDDNIDLETISNFNLFNNSAALSK